MIRSPIILFLLLIFAGGSGYLVATGKWHSTINTIQTVLVPIRYLLESKGLLPKTAPAAKPATPEKKEE